MLENSSSLLSKHRGSKAPSQPPLLPQLWGGGAEKERLEQDSEPWHFLPGEEALGDRCLGQVGVSPDWS